MALNVADLIATLGLNTEGFRKGAEDASKASEKISKSTTEAGASATKMGETLDKAGEHGKQGLAKVGTEAQKTGKSLSDLITPANLAAAAIGTALAASLKSAISGATQFADEIHRLQLLTGSSVRDIASLVDVANDVGAEFDQVKMALLRLANASGDTDGVLNQLNLTAKDGVGRFLQAAQAISTITDANQRAAVVSEIFGARVAADLLPVIERLRNGTKDLGAETNEFANILGDKGVPALRELGIAQGQVGDAMLQLKIVIAKDLLPILSPLTAGLQRTIELFAAIPSPVRTVIEVLGGAVIAIYAVNTALGIFGVTGFAMFGPAGWVALAIAGVAVLASQIDGLSGKMTRAWELFKQRGMVEPQGLTSGPASVAVAATPQITILSKDVVEANAAIQKQIDALKAQRIELEGGEIAALKYALAHGEMAKASPKAKAELVALTQSLIDFKAEQDIAVSLQEMLTKDTNEATEAIRANAKALKEQHDELALNTLGDAVDELNAMAKAEKALKEATDDANQTIKEQNLLFIDAGRYADELRADVDDMIAGIKETVSAEKERIDLLVRLKQLSPAEATIQQTQALTDGIAKLKEYNTELTTAYGTGAKVVKDVDREILKLQADQADLLAKTKGWGSAFRDVFEGALGILSLFGVKIGKVILMLQNLPQALGGLSKMFAGINSLASLAGIAAGATIPGTAAAAVGDLGKAAGISAENLTGLTGVVGLVERALMMFGNGLLGLFSFFSQIVQGIASGGGIVNTITTAFGGLVKAGGALSTVFSGLSTVGGSVYNLLSGAGSLAETFQSIFDVMGLTSGGFGVSGLMGGTMAAGGATQVTSGTFATFLGQWVPVAGALYSLATTIQNFFAGRLEKAIGGAIGGAIGAAVGAFFGGPIGGFIGFSIGNFIGSFIGGLFAKAPKAAISAAVLPFDRDDPSNAIRVSISGNALKSSQENALAEELIKMLNEVLVRVVGATVEIMKVLPPSIAAELDKALTDLATNGVDILGYTKFKGSKAGKKLVALAQSLPDIMIQVLSESLGFGDIDLKELGGGEATKGFDAMMTALGALSAIVKEVGPAIDLSNVSLAQFTKGAIDLFKKFANEGEAVIDTIKRVMQTFGEIIQVMDQNRVMIAAITGDIGAAFGILVDQVQRANSQMIALADALTVAVESGAKPEEVLAAAKSVQEALQAELQAVQALKTAVDALNKSITDGVDLIVSLTQRINALRGTELSASDFNLSIDSFAHLFNVLPDVNSRIALFASGVALLAENLSLFTANIPLIAQGFDLIMEQIRGMKNPTEAIAALKSLAGAVESGLTAVIAAVNRQTQARIAGLNAERAAIGQASVAQKTELEAQKTALQQTFDLQRTALQTALSLSQQWLGVLESVKSQLVDLFNLLAPTRPLTSLNEVRTQFESAFAAFQAAPTTEGATGVQDLARQLLQLAQQTPGYDLPSAAFQALAATVRTALESIQTFAASQPTQEAIQAQIAALDQQQADSLASIDAQIAVLDARQAAALANIEQQIQQASIAGQAQIQQFQDGAGLGLEAIRAQLVIEVTALAAQQAKAAEALQAVLGDKSFEQFITEKQAEATKLLRGINDTLELYLGQLVSQFVPGAVFTAPQLAGGMDYVPSDRFPAYLDRGERVLTAADNRAYSNGSGGGTSTVTITLAPTIQLGSGNKSTKDDLDRALVEIVNGPSLTRPALLELAKRAK